MSTALLTDLRTALEGTAVSDRPVDLARAAHDASHVLLHPQAFVVARDTPDVARTLAIASRHGVPVTFRSGGTSLSGQAVTDGVLIDTRRGFRDVEVLDDGARVRCRPGATVRTVNAHLAPYGRALGPDPASEAACTIGGVVADNSSGMACGTTRNTYRTLDCLEAVLLSGTVIDTALPDADARLKAAEPEVWEGLARLRDRVRGNPDSVRRIEHQYSMKNTMGYGVNSFLDFDEPVQILAHLLVGSEGTLGFISSVTFRTVPVHQHISTALLVFEGIETATAALPDLVGAGAETAELMDAASLRVAQHFPTPVDALTGLEVRDHTALLVEARAAEAGELDEHVHRLEGVLDGLRHDGLLTDLAIPTRFSADPVPRAQAWAVRKGLYTAVAGARRAGSTALLEDIVVPMPALTQAVRDLGEICARHGYDEAVVFGHAKDANLHFMINPDLRDPAQVETLGAFSDDLVDLVLAADGSLKAEHGTGRVMAPFVERQFGSELYAVMREVKRLLDPTNTLNPGVVITDDERAHLRALKAPTPVDEAVDRCVECGYCEPVCPSRDVTTTPRQRIVLMREMAAHRAAGREDEADAIAKDFDYMAVQTCAADSLCQPACPVGIDTGIVMKGFRKDAQTPAVQRVGAALADNWGPTLTGLRVGVGVADHVPGTLLERITATARAVLSPDLVPLVGDDLPGPGLSRRTNARQEPGDVVLLPSCIGELFAPEGDSPGAAQAFLAVCDRAGITVRLPKDMDGLCCGTVWRSKGLTEGLGQMAVRTARALLEASEDGRVPVVMDASSCTHGLHALPADLDAAGEYALAERVAGLQIMDATRFVAEHVLPRLTVRRTVRSAVLHPTCSDRHVDDIPALRAIAEAVADEVVVPVESGCCGFAGDRGMLHPELTAGATAREAEEVDHRTYDLYLSSNRTCELGMSRATGHTYHHVLEALADALV
ncbi:FAD-binding and (Fe-S)-binding domain-containing protein [Mobilicoccus pelagius]|uniref:D-lactate dehydrogenase (cytochrome) n=1 Tax=Mobilicoccus pelagius NBRC 104925 TaxID=1089455 RepID=H5UNL8_9MICO|nr:FAD-binding and (Fe-S)-binding domain-containing protein [Mobilicoccus pelagius]GAB47326.1 putative FAD-linked oxidase [Mobilicoccus pelagius NBRC 104925]